MLWHLQRAELQPVYVGHNVLFCRYCRLLKKMFRLKMLLISHLRKIRHWQLTNMTSENSNDQRISSLWLNSVDRFYCCFCCLILAGSHRLRARFVVEKIKHAGLAFTKALLKWQASFTIWLSNESFIPGSWSSDSEFFLITCFVSFIHSSRIYPLAKYPSSHISKRGHAVTNFNKQCQALNASHAIGSLTAAGNPGAILWLPI